MDYILCVFLNQRIKENNCSVASCYFFKKQPEKNKLIENYLQFKFKIVLLHEYTDTNFGRSVTNHRKRMHSKRLKLRRSRLV